MLGGDRYDNPARSVATVTAGSAAALQGDVDCKVKSVPGVTKRGSLVIELAPPSSLELK